MQGPAQTLSLEGSDFLAQPLAPTPLHAAP